MKNNIAGIGDDQRIVIANFGKVASLKVGAFIALSFICGVSVFAYGLYDEGWMFFERRFSLIGLAGLVYLLIPVARWFVARMPGGPLIYFQNGKVIYIHPKTYAVPLQNIRTMKLKSGLLENKLLINDDFWLSLPLNAAAEEPDVILERMQNLIASGGITIDPPTDRRSHDEDQAGGGLRDGRRPGGDVRL